MTTSQPVQLFESTRVRSHWDAAQEKWYFSVVDVVQVLTDSTIPKRYWSDLRRKLEKESGQPYEEIVRLKMPAADGRLRETDAAAVPTLLRLIQSIPSPKAEPFKRWLAWTGLSVQAHKSLKSLKTQNLRDHMSEAELIFTALAELSTRQIAETEEAQGLQQNAKAGKEGGRVAKRAKDDLEKRTGQKVVMGINFLPPGKSMPVQLSATPARKTNKSLKK